MKRVLSVMLLLLAGCRQISPDSGFGTQTTSHVLTVFAAASLADAFSEIAQNFKTANPGVKVVLNFAGSQALRTQIEQGAEADVFASANTREMDILVNESHVLAGTARIFVTNQLVVIMPDGNPANISSLADLANPGVKLVLAAEEVPVGQYARQTIENLNTIYENNYIDKVLANVVSNEDNVKQVVTKVQLGEADVGIVYTSDALATPGIKIMEIPSTYNIIAQYPIALLTAAQQPVLAAEFIDYVLSPEGQDALRKWGFHSASSVTNPK